MIKLICYLILIFSICFTGFEIFQALNKLQNNYLQTYSELLEQ